MNLDYWLRRLSGRATCTLGRRAKLAPSARIRNIRGDDQYITIGSQSLIAGELLVFPHGGSITLGKWCYVGEGARIWSAGAIEIGDHVLISHNVNIFDSLTHPLSARQRHAQFREIMEKGHPEVIDLGERPVTLKNNAWIGANAIILRGVTVGEGAIIGAAAVVTSDVPPYSVVVGNPARVIRVLGEDER